MNRYRHPHRSILSTFVYAEQETTLHGNEKGLLGLFAVCTGQQLPRQTSAWAVRSCKTYSHSHLAVLTSALWSLRGELLLPCWMLRAFSEARQGPRGQGQQSPSSTLFDLQVALGKTQHPKKNSWYKLLSSHSKEETGGTVNVILELNSRAVLLICLFILRLISQLWMFFLWKINQNILVWVYEKLQKKLTQPSRSPNQRNRALKPFKFIQ